MRRRSEHSSQMVISEGLPHILQTWCACSGRASDRRGTIFMPCLLSNPVGRLTDAGHSQFYRGPTGLRMQNAARSTGPNSHSQVGALSIIVTYSQLPMESRRYTSIGGVA